jgi:hypothetical protein
MFCPQCRQTWIVEGAGNREVVRGKRCPVCRSLLTGSRMSLEFPVDEYAYRGSGGTITISEVIRQTRGPSSAGKADPEFASRLWNGPVDEGCRYSSNCLRISRREVDRFSVIMLTVVIAISLIILTYFAVASVPMARLGVGATASARYAPASPGLTASPSGLPRSKPPSQK